MICLGSPFSFHVSEHIRIKYNEEEGKKITMWEMTGKVSFYYVD